MQKRKGQISQNVDKENMQNTMHMTKKDYFYKKVYSARQNPCNCQVR